MAKDHIRHLEKRGKTYRFTRWKNNVRIHRSLGTDDLAEAIRRRDLINAELDGTASKTYEVEKRIARRGDGVEIMGLLGEDDPTRLAVAVQGQIPLADVDIEKWTAPFSGVYRARCKRGHKLLVEFLRKHKLAETFEATTTQVALDFTAWREGEGDAPSGLVMLISGLRGLWDRTGDRHANWVNPWRVVKVRLTKSDPERPFEPSEARAILVELPEKTPAGDAARIAALTGARLSEVLRLTPSDIVDDMMIIRRSKTQAGVRRVPVSSKLAPIVSRLKYGKGDNEPLIAAGFRVGDKFSRALRKLKLADVRKGSRRSKINFHSWRRTAVMQLDRAGIPEIVSARLIGHKVRTLTYGVYNSAGASDAQLRAAVEVLELLM